MSAVSGGQGPYNCCGSNDSSQSPDISPRDEKLIKKIADEASSALENALGGCIVCGCPGGSCPLNKPVKLQPTDEQAWRKVLETATRKLRELSRGDNNNPGNPNAYDWHPEDKPYNSNNEHEEDKSNPNAYMG